MSTGNAVYETHLDIVKELGEKVRKAAAVSPHGNQARDLRDLATAYSIVVDKLATFHMTSVMADGSRTTPLKDQM